MKHVLAYSGGKDSTAAALLLQERGIDFTAVFADTGWEHPLTYGYLWGAAGTFLAAHDLTILRSSKYEGFMDLVVRRKMIPGKTTRFCTQELKIFPLWDYVASIDDDVTLYQGIRAEESLPRTRAGARDEVAEGSEAGHYRPAYTIERPLFTWSAREVFAIHDRHGIEPNPLYKIGAGRVGCWPCIFVNHRELRVLLKDTPEMIERLRAVEKAATEAGGNPDSPRTMFRADYIPQRYCSIPIKTKSGQFLRAPSVDDVARYLLSVDEDQLPLLDTPTCLSIYNLCE